MSKPIAEPTSVNRIVPTVLPSRRSNTQWNSLLRDMVDAALFRIGRRPPPSAPLVKNVRVRALLAEYRIAHRRAQQFALQLQRRGFATDGSEHYQRRNRVETRAQEAHEARIRTVQGVRAAALTELVGTVDPKEQRVILRAAAKKLARV